MPAAPAEDRGLSSRRRTPRRGSPEEPPSAADRRSARPRCRRAIVASRAQGARRPIPTSSASSRCDRRSPSARRRSPAGIQAALAQARALVRSRAGPRRARGRRIVHRHRGVPSSRRACCSPTATARAPRADSTRSCARERAPRRCCRRRRPCPTRAEAVRAEALDRLCAEVDVQVGTHACCKSELARSPARGCAAWPRRPASSSTPRASSSTSRRTRAPSLYTLQNLRNEPFTAESLRSPRRRASCSLLDVPRVQRPGAHVRPDAARPRSAWRKTLERRSSTTTARRSTTPRSRKIRAQVEATADALRESRIEPGSPRALRCSADTLGRGLARRAFPRPRRPGQGAARPRLEAAQPALLRRRRADDQRRRVRRALPRAAGARGAVSRAR